MSIVVTLDVFQLSNGMIKRTQYIKHITHISYTDSHPNYYILIKSCIKQTLPIIVVTLLASQSPIS